MLLRYLHRYGGLLVSLQILVWSLGGFFMAFWNFSDLYVDPPVQPIHWQAVKLSTTEIPALLPANTQIQSIRLFNLGSEPFYLVERSNQSPLLLDQKGQIQSPLSPELATTQARSLYTGSGHLQTIDLLPHSTGNYVSDKPVYRARFDDAQKSEIYLDPNSGQLLGRRKAIWRWYNRFWTWHLMKYSPNAQANKLLLLGFAGLAFVVSLTGIWKFFRP